MQKIRFSLKPFANVLTCLSWSGIVMFMLLLSSSACNNNYQRAKEDKQQYNMPITKIPEEEVVVEEAEDIEIMLDMEVIEEFDGEQADIMFLEAPNEIMLEEIQPDLKITIPEEFNTEEYDRIYENGFKKVWQHPISTFSIDVDNASYSNVRRYLTQWHQLPPPDAVRIEEMINYFSYDYPQPPGEHPFAFVTEVGVCPWNPQNKLLHIGIQGKSLNYENLKPSNLVFLMDVSGSMDEANKLPLVKQSFRLLLDALQPTDQVAIVVYAGAAGLVLPMISNLPQP